jgi:hypothetical protein
MEDIISKRLISNYFKKDVLNKNGLSENEILILIESEIVLKYKSNKIKKTEIKNRLNIINNIMKDKTYIKNRAKFVYQHRLDKYGNINNTLPFVICEIICKMREKYV